MRGGGEGVLQTKSAGAGAGAAGAGGVPLLGTCSSSLPPQQSSRPTRIGLHIRAAQRLGAARRAMLTAIEPFTIGLAVDPPLPIIDSPTPSRACRASICVRRRRLVPPDGKRSYCGSVAVWSGNWRRRNHPAPAHKPDSCQPGKRATDTRRARAKTPIRSSAQITSRGGHTELTAALSLQPYTTVADCLAWSISSMLT